MKKVLAVKRNQGDQKSLDASRGICRHQGFLRLQKQAAWIGCLQKEPIWGAQIPFGIHFWITYRVNSSLQDVFYPICPWKASQPVQDHMNMLASLSPTLLPSLGLQEALSLVNYGYSGRTLTILYFLTADENKHPRFHTQQLSDAEVPDSLAGCSAYKKEAALHDRARSRASLPHFRLLNLCTEEAYSSGAKSWSMSESGIHRARDKLLPYIHFLPRNEVSLQHFAPWTGQHAPVADHNTKPSTSFLFSYVFLHSSPLPPSYTAASFSKAKAECLLMRNERGRQFPRGAMNIKDVDNSWLQRL